ILKKAQENGLIKFDIVDLRNYATDRHRTTDDAPYGGGQGMVMKPEPLIAAIDHARSQAPHSRVILLTPRGRVFDQQTAGRLSQATHIIVLCGCYEGGDERVSAFAIESGGIGEQTLSSCERAALVWLAALARL